MRRSTFLVLLVSGAVKSTYAWATGGGKSPVGESKPDCGCTECRFPEGDGGACGCTACECRDCGCTMSEADSARPTCCRTNGPKSLANSSGACGCEVCECPACDGASCSCDKCDCVGCGCAA